MRIAAHYVKTGPRAGDRCVLTIFEALKLPASAGQSLPFGLRRFLSCLPSKPRRKYSSASASCSGLLSSSLCGGGNLHSSRHHRPWRSMPAVDRLIGLLIGIEVEHVIFVQTPAATRKLGLHEHLVVRPVQATASAAGAPQRWRRGMALLLFSCRKLHVDVGSQGMQPTFVFTTTIPFIVKVASLLWLSGLLLIPVPWSCNT